MSSQPRKKSSVPKSRPSTPSPMKPGGDFVSWPKLSAPSPNSWFEPKRGGDGADPSASHRLSIHQGRYKGGVGNLEWTEALAHGGTESAPSPSGWARLQGKFHRFSRFKKWIYFFVNHPECVASGAIVHTGYGISAFVSVFDPMTHDELYDRSFLGIPGVQGDVRIRGASDYEAEVSLSPLSGFEMRITPQSVQLEDPRAGVSLRFELETSDARANRIFSLVGSKGEDPFIQPVYTQKEVLIPVVAGEVRVQDRLHCSWSVDSPAPSPVWGGADLTVGFLPRKTAWNWAFGFGKDSLGRRIGWNLSSANHLGLPEGESVIWIEDQIFPLYGLRWEQVSEETMSASVRSADGALFLQFEAWGRHQEKKSLLIIESDFTQWSGSFRGFYLDPQTGKRVEILAIAGQFEEQSVLW